MDPLKRHTSFGRFEHPITFASYKGGLDDRVLDPAKETLHGWYSATAASNHGSFYDSTPSGAKVEVTEVCPTYKEMSDATYVGELLEYLGSASNPNAPIPLAIVRISKDDRPHLQRGSPEEDVF
jgi:hypothetical protein